MASHIRLAAEDLTRNGVNRRVTENLPAVRPCFACSKMTRPGKMRAEDAGQPTLVRRNAFYCSGCGKRYGDMRPAALAAEFAAIEKPEQDERPEMTDAEILHAAKALNKFMHQRQQRERRRERLAKVGNVETPHQPQPRGDGGGRVVASPHGPRPVADHQQVAGIARLHAEGAPGRADLLQRRA